MGNDVLGLITHIKVVECGRIYTDVVALTKKRNIAIGQDLQGANAILNTKQIKLYNSYKL